MSKTVLKSGYTILQDKLEFANGDRYEVSVLNPEGKEVWWTLAYSEAGLQEALQRAVDTYWA